MLIFPAIDLYEGKAVRLFKGDYAQKTIYSEDPLSVASDFLVAGATHIHLVDLEGAKTGKTPNFDIIKKIKRSTGLFCEVGGGIRSFKTIEKYLSVGLDRVILGTVAVTEKGFVQDAVKEFGNAIAVGADVKDGFIAVKGWTENSDRKTFDFCEEMSSAGVKTLICTDVSKDGAMAGANADLYKELANRFSMNVVASGGVCSLKDVAVLKSI
ncbi:MAG: 1-(5-phosphoribosyl)-5-[Clostridia bacterium]|nr:1-(5-phosphoribosyl)-5-[(5-phosphoribosylamino)methylideneamino]imidazole-4-carboxamide isomerase [Clostridia bacterium]